MNIHRESLLAWLTLILRVHIADERELYRFSFANHATGRVARGNLTPGLPQNPGVTISRHRALLILTANGP